MSQSFEPQNSDISLCEIAEWDGAKAQAARQIRCGTQPALKNVKFTKAFAHFINCASQPNNGPAVDLTLTGIKS
jgi:hypothetical protein